MQITYTAHAWADNIFWPIEEIMSGKSAPMLASEGPGEDGYFERKGYTYIGTAQVTVDVVNGPDQIVMYQIAALNAQLESVRAESQKEENAILLEISKLQATSMA